MAFEVVLIPIIVVVFIILIVCCVRTKKTRRGSSAAAMDTASDDDNDDSWAISPGSDKPRTVNSKGLRVLTNGVVSMRDLELAHQVPAKSKDGRTPRLFNASLTLSKAVTLFTFIHGGKHVAVEKFRDESARLVILQSAAPYCLPLNF